MILRLLDAGEVVLAQPFGHQMRADAAQEQGRGGARIRRLGGA